MVKKKSGVMVLLKEKSGAVWRLLFLRSGRVRSTAPCLAAGTNASRRSSVNGGHVSTLAPLVSGGDALAGPSDWPRSQVGQEPAAPGSWYGPGKRVLDFVLALAILVLTAPLMLMAMLLVRLTSRGPALYSQTRVGLKGRPFIIYKIRSMTHRCEERSGARWSTPGDARVTTIGRLLRKTHIDELPQLWNVLKGEMSLVGPRPERPEFVPQLEQAIPHYRRRLLVRPGLTGLAQVQLPPDTDLNSVRLKLAHDLWYVRHLGLGFDLRLLGATAFHVVHMSAQLIRSLFCFPAREKIVKAYVDLGRESTTASAARTA